MGWIVHPIGGAPAPAAAAMPHKYGERGRTHPPSPDAGEDSGAMGGQWRALRHEGPPWPATAPQDHGWQPRLGVDVVLPLSLRCTCAPRVTNNPLHSSSSPPNRQAEQSVYHTGSAPIL